MAMVGMVRVALAGSGLSMANGVATMLKNGTDSVYQILGTEEVWVETDMLDLGDGKQDKYIDAIVLDMTNRGDLTAMTLRVYIKDDQTEDWREAANSPFSIDNTSQVVRPRETARFWKIRLADAVPSVKWKWTRIEFYGQLMGGDW